MLRVSAVGWTATIALVVGLFAFDLVFAARRPHRVEMREAAAWSAFYIGLALSFGVALGVLAGWSVGGQYFAGYAVEKSLSVDNLFVFVIIIQSFAVPVEQQRRALTLGIAFALAARAVLIALGTALLDAFSFMFLVFGAVLLFTAVQMLRHRDQDPEVADNPLVAAVERALPFTKRYRGGSLLARIDGRRVLTPLALVLVAIGSTDLLFAFDSIPAVFGVTQYPYIVFCANAFALLGLRALFFLVAGFLDRLVYLSTGLALILAVIGVKLVLHFGHAQDASVPEISTAASLVAIVAILSATALMSLAASRRDPLLRAHAGAVPLPRRGGSARGRGSSERDAARAAERTDSVEAGGRKR
jgi:tellurite resistance protein TerC